MPHVVDDKVDRELGVRRVETSDIMLEWSEATWDTAIFGTPVLQITNIDLRTSEAHSSFRNFEVERDRVQAGLVSCRLYHERMRESMFLEEHGFRFIEMLYQPELDILKGVDDLSESGLYATRVEKDEISAVMEIAGSAFRNERFHIDPRLDSVLGDQRYCNWVKSSLTHPTQKLYVVRDSGQIVAFFVTEMKSDRTCYWHLNAVTTSAQGKGYGKRAWNTMLELARQQGAKRVQTCIVARNHRVLNLYARLGFRFPPPLMTFHWVRSAAI